MGFHLYFGQYFGSHKRLLNFKGEIGFCSRVDALSKSIIYTFPSVHKIIFL